MVNNGACATAPTAHSTTTVWTQTLSKGPKTSVPPEGLPTAVQKKKATQGTGKGPGKATTALESSQATTSAKSKHKK
ncbi:unnamed protein product [Rhizoctonia solani]|uniref:Uncharacterized protein n=1 Tax=Rhizoctonia solani TaxID=456999 RepID=A0A8H3CVQ1_9AGAM|nr:unnamed protein product [Rhizoctonia solani]